jgi:hypothetical protein
VPRRRDAACAARRQRHGGRTATLARLSLMLIALALILAVLFLAVLFLTVLFLTVLFLTALILTALMLAALMLVAGPCLGAGGAATEDGSAAAARLGPPAEAPLSR